MSDIISSEYKVEYERRVSGTTDSWVILVTSKGIDRKKAVKFISYMQEQFSDSMRNFKLITIDSFPNPGE